MQTTDVEAAVKLLPLNEGHDSVVRVFASHAATAARTLPICTRGCRSSC